MEGNAYNSIAAGAIIATSINFRLDYAQSEINRRHTSYATRQFQFQLRPAPAYRLSTIE